MPSFAINCTSLYFRNRVMVVLGCWGPHAEDTPKGSFVSRSDYLKLEQVE